MTSKKQFEQTVRLDVEARVREGVKAVLENILQEEMTEHLEAGYRELTPTRRGELRAATTLVTSLHPQAISSAWRYAETGRAISSRSSPSDTSPSNTSA